MTMLYGSREPKVCSADKVAPNATWLFPIPKYWVKNMLLGSFKQTLDLKLLPHFKEAGKTFFINSHFEHSNNLITLFFPNALHRMK